MQNNAPTITKSVAEDLALGKNGSYGNDGNVLQDSLWDQIPVPAALAATQTFFSTPQGATKGIVETNLTDPSKLPNGQTFLIKAICIGLCANRDDSVANADMIAQWFYTIMEASVWEIKIAGREFDMRKPGKEFLPPIAVAGPQSAANTGSAQSMFLANGKIKLNATPIPLGQMVTFQVIQRCGNTNAAVGNVEVGDAFAGLNAMDASLHVRLEGILTRAI